MPILQVLLYTLRRGFHLTTRPSSHYTFLCWRVLISGLLVPADNYRLCLGDKGDRVKIGGSSPFVDAIAFHGAGWALVRPRPTLNCTVNIPHFC